MRGPSRAKRKHVFRQINFTNSAGVREIGVIANTARTTCASFENCLFDGFTAGVYGDYAFVYDIYQLTLLNCEVKNCTVAGVSNTGATSLQACYIHDNVVGLLVDGADNYPWPVDLWGCTFYNNSSDGVQVKSAAYNSGAYRWVTAIQCNFVSNGNDGLKYYSGTAYDITLINCIFYGNSSHDVELGASPTAYRIYNNAFNGSNVNCPTGTGAVTLSASPFNNAAGGDFTLNSTAGGGLLCRGAGYQSTIT